MTVREMLVRMDSEELSQQMAYDLSSDEKFSEEHEKRRMYKAAMEHAGIEGEIKWER